MNGAAQGWIEHQLNVKRRIFGDAVRSMTAAAKRHKQTGEAMAIVLVAAQRLQRARRQVVTMTELVERMRSEGSN